MSILGSYLWTARLPVVAGWLLVTGVVVAAAGEVGPSKAPGEKSAPPQLQQQQPLPEPQALARAIVQVPEVFSAKDTSRRLEPAAQEAGQGPIAYPVEDPVPTAPHDAPVGPPPPAAPEGPAEGHRTTPAQVWVRGSFESVQVNTDKDGHNIVGDAANESSVAVDPTDPDKMAIGWRQFDTINSDFREAGIAYSRDGGRTWTNLGVLDPGMFRTDPVLRSDAFGDFYYSSLSTRQLRSVEVFRSTDGGVTWSDPVPAFGGDKQWLTVDATGGLGDGHLYQIWNIQFSCCPPNDWTRSVDGGLSFQPPLDIPDPKMKWGTMDVGTDGELYMGGALLNQSSHVIARSDNAQYQRVTPSFRFVNNVNLGGSTRSHGGFSTPNPVGLLGQVWVATDHSDQPSRGNVYMLSSVNPPGPDPLDVHFIRSTDQGLTWSKPVRVNDDPPGTNAWQWLGTMSVAKSGRIDAVWDDTRNGGGDPKLSELFYAYSTDTGKTWSDNIIITQMFNSHLGFPRQNKMGDYNDMLSNEAGVLLTFAATFNKEQDIYFMRLKIDCNENGVHDGDDIARGTSKDKNNNGIPDECEGCTGNERISKAKCKERRGAGRLTVKLKKGADRDSFRVELSTGESVEGNLNRKGKGKAKFKNLPLGNATATATWGCGAKAQKDYRCG